MGLRGRGFGVMGSIRFAFRSVVVAFGTVVQQITGSQSPDASDLSGVTAGDGSTALPAKLQELREVAPISYNTARPYSSPKVWISERVWQPHVPLQPDEPYTLNIQYDAPVWNPNFSQRESEILEMDVPEEGLALELVLTSDSIRMAPAPAAVFPQGAPGQPAYSARFSLRLRPRQTTPTQQLRITPDSVGDPTVTFLVFAEGRLYQKFSIAAEVRQPYSNWGSRIRSSFGKIASTKLKPVPTLSPGPYITRAPQEAAESAEGWPPLASEPSIPLHPLPQQESGYRVPKISSWSSFEKQEPEVSPPKSSVRLQDLTVLAPGGELQKAARKSVQQGIDELTFTPTEPNSAVASWKGSHISVRWSSDTAALRAPLENLYRSLETFREQEYAYLDAIPAADLEARLSTMPDGAEAHRDSEQKWMDVQTRKHLYELAVYGYELYKVALTGDARSKCVERLRPGSRLNIIWSRLEEFPARPHIPWTLMYCSSPTEGAVDLNNFLGFRFRIHYQVWDPSQLRADALGPIPEIRPAYCLYWGDDLMTETEWQRARFGRVPQSAFIPLNRISDDPLRRVRDFLSASDGRSSRLIYLYCKCDANEKSAPSLVFGNDAARDVLSHVDLVGKLRLPDNPVVFVNACESASAQPDMPNPLQRAFLRSGCRAYVGTEGKVPVQLASRFAAVFFHYFFDTSQLQPISVGEAIYRTRRFLWANYRNIGGLFYTHTNDFDAYAGETTE